MEFTESFADVTATALEESFEYTGMDLDEMAMAHVAEAEANYSAIMTAIGIHEAQTFAETGEEVVYTEGALSDIKDKIVSFIKSVWNKIVAIFKRFIRMFDAWNKDDKEFLNKYKAEINKRVGRMKDFKFTGYKFTIEKANAEKAIAGLTLNSVIGLFALNTVDASKLEDIEENFDDKTEELRGATIAAMGGSSGALNASEFSKELFMVFRDGEDSKTELSDSDIDLNKIMGELATNKESKRNAEKVYKECKRVCDQAIKEFEKQDKDALKQSVDVKGKEEGERKAASAVSRAINLKIRALRAALAIMQTINGAHLTALKDQSRQNKAICVKAMNGIKAESVGYWEHEIEEGASFLSGVKLI